MRPKVRILNFILKSNFNCLILLKGRPAFIWMCSMNAFIVLFGLLGKVNNN